MISHHPKYMYIARPVMLLLVCQHSFGIENLPQQKQNLDFNRLKLIEFIPLQGESM